MWQVRQVDQIDIAAVAGQAFMSSMNERYIRFLIVEHLTRISVLGLLDDYMGGVLRFCNGIVLFVRIFSRVCFFCLCRKCVERAFRLPIR